MRSILLAATTLSTACVTTNPNTHTQDPPIAMLAGGPTSTGTASVPAAPVALEVCSGCDLVVDWSAVDVWSDGAPVDPDKNEWLYGCFYEMTVEAFELDGPPTTCGHVQSFPLEDEDRSLTIPAMAMEMMADVGVIGLWVLSGDGHVSETMYVICTAEGGALVTFE